MRFDDIAIPAGFAWSSPFAKWQGSLAVDPTSLGGLVLGWTIPQREVFYGAPRRI